ncbi:uncharacterized protein LOC122621667 [Drosophila teissieri]|uniref:uncharacterized protein LOC122621667 n=1 Tax=Drosophila teissieri TaxID=7243 RepID=UPI001CB9E4C5|nr:uncharacterized protein LOC122621667 [Drosophila teissieri]
MDSTFGKVFMFLTDLAWKSRLTIPIMVTTAFLVMDIRLQIEINIQSGQFNASDLDDVQEGLDDQFGLHDHGSDDETGSDSYSDEEYTNDDGNSEASHYSVDIYDPWGSDDEIDANYSREMRF